MYGNPLGGNLEQMRETALRQPELVSQAINTRLNGQLLFDLQVPFGFLALASPRTWMAQLAALGSNLISSNLSLKLIGHYTVVPWR